jgi:hypothetical protein
MSTSFMPIELVIAFGSLADPVAGKSLGEE